MEGPLTQQEYDRMLLDNQAALTAHGAVATASAEIEGAVADLLVLLVDAPLGGVFVYGTPWRSMHDTAKALMQAIGGERADEVVELLKRGASLQEQRNDVIHGRWAVNIEHPEHQMFVRSRRNRQPNYTQTTTDRLNALAYELYEVAIRISEIAGAWPD